MESPVLSNLSALDDNYSANPRPIGDYLVSASICTESDILKAVARQSALLSRGEERSIGELLLEMDLVTLKDLSEVLRQQNLDRFASSALFQYLDRSTITDIYNQSNLRVFKPGEIVYRQNDPSQFLAVVLQGTVSLVHKTKQGRDIDIQVVRPGESFGEMGLLSSQLRLMTAKCLEASELLMIPGDLFKALYHSHPLLSQATVRKWFANIVSGQRQGSVYLDSYYKELLSHKETLPCVQMVGNTKKARKLRQKVKESSNSEQPVLLVGEPGTMRTRLAQLIHESDNSGDGPFIIFDPEKMPEFVFHSLDRMNATHFKDELGQIGALFGCGKVESQAGTPWQGFLKLAHNGTLVINGVESLTPKVQRLLVQYLKTGLFYAVDCDRPANAGARIIFIAADELNLSNELYNCLKDLTIKVPSLRERKRDLREICESMVEGLSRELNKDIKTIDREAMNIIMDYDWPGNFRELEEVIRRAVSLAKGGTLSAEEIYVGRVQPSTGKKAYNLLTIPAIKQFFSSPFFPRIPQLVIAVMFLVVIAMGIWGSPSPDSNVSLLLVWANWEPLLIISCFFLARIWCSFCPIGVIGDWFHKLKHRRMKLPPQYLNYGFAVSAAGLAIVFWSQAALEMWQHPKETAGLLLAMLLSAIIFALLFEGHVWCRCICPLGQMTATFARTAIVEVRSHHPYCHHECTTYDCYSGSATIPGCKLAKGPFALETNQSCNLCGNCIKLCPHDSVRLNLRMPGWELINAKSADLGIVLFVPLLWGTQLFRALGTTDMPVTLAAATGSMAFGYALLMAVCTFFAYLLTSLGRMSLGDLKTAGGTVADSVYVLAMLPLIYANEICLRLVPLLSHTADFFVILGNQVGYEFPQIAFRLDRQSIQILQIFLILAGLLISMKILEKYRRQAQPPARAALRKFAVYLPFFIVAGLSVLLQ